MECSLGAQIARHYLQGCRSILAATDHLVSLPYVDPDQVYLGGHSTGGTMVMLVGACSDRFRAIFSLGPVAAAAQYGGDFVYCDPPYVPDTRTAQNAYEYEMSTDDHIDLANVLLNFKGKVIVSGYHSALYKRLYKPWKCVQKKIANHASQSKTKVQKTECIWMNY